MSLDLRPVQVRLSEEAYDALRLIADAHDQDLGGPRMIKLKEALLGKSHAIKVTAERLARAIKTDKPR